MNVRVLTPMNQLSALFHQTIDPLMANQRFAQHPRYREALLYNLLLQQSDFRY
jgi:hypothetical protein